MSPKIPLPQYEEFAKQFNPVKFDADVWVKVAKDAGMKYIVFTTKHHDGLAMFDTKACPWNIMQASPYGKDPLEDLAAACSKYGIKLGFSYSVRDWYNCGYSDGKSRDPDDYIYQIAVPEVKELCSNYGEAPVLLWWDAGHDFMNAERGQKIYDAVHAIRPNVIMNNRLVDSGANGKPVVDGFGDYATPEGFIPSAVQGDWETCMTMNGSWGFHCHDNNWKSTETILRNLCDIASKGGNYLLNVGPTREGVIPQPSLER